MSKSETLKVLLAAIISSYVSSIVIMGFRTFNFDDVVLMLVFFYSLLFTLGIGIPGSFLIDYFITTRSWKSFLIKVFLHGLAGALIIIFLLVVQIFNDAFNFLEQLQSVLFLSAVVNAICFYLVRITVEATCSLLLMVINKEINKRQSR